MFNSIRSRYGKKVKRAAALLITAAVLCGFTGCGKNETSSSAPLSSSSVPQSVPADKSEVSQSRENNSGNNSVTSTPQSVPDEESKDSQSSEVNSDNTSSSGTQSGQNNGQSEFNFDEAVKNITLFGHKISLPCAWSDFGEDFSHDDMYIPSGDDLLCNLQYKGEYIGCIIFSDCVDAEDTAEVESKPVIQLVMGFSNYGYPYTSNELKYFETIKNYTGPIEFNFGNLSMSSDEKDIIAELGEPGKIGGEVSGRHWLHYDYDNGYLDFYINDNERVGRIMELYIGVN